MLQKDKAFWVGKPGANAYTLHDAYYNYEMMTEKIKPRKYLATLHLESIKHFLIRTAIPIRPVTL